ncbi:MAG: PAS domain S-box protein, partial [Anaerolineae bacterium]|nr:PAS domain S-box protein [Anaerolineae bacterium]
TDMFAQLRRCMAERSATHLENEFIFPDGSKGWFELSVQPVPEGLFILSMDIAERKQAVEALAQSEVRYRAIVEDQTEFICRYTPDYVLTFVNEAYGRLFNRPPEEELVGQNLMQLIRPENRQPLRDKVAGLTPQEPVADDQHLEFTVDGSQRWLYWTDRGIFDEAGQLVEVQAVGRDITEQVEAQRQLEFQKTLLECELEASLDGILIASETREWLYVNQRFIEMWGLPAEVVAARSVAGGLAHVRNLVAEPERFMADLDYLYTNPSEVNRQEVSLNDERVFERYTAPVVSASGDYYGRLWSYRDVTRQRQLEAQLLQAQKMEAIGRLAGGIAHDFNNLLVPIVGYVEMGLMRLSPTEKLYADLTRVREAAERATSLTRQILAFSRKQVLQMEIVDLNTVVTDFQKMTHRLIREDIELVTILEPALFRVKADPGQIGQVLLNLVVNARDAMPLGGKLTLQTANVFLDEAYVKRYAEAQPPGHYAMLAVSDTGQGMDAATRRQIFEPFFTTKERGKGTGLGLSTVFGIVKQHGGNIWVYSEPGQGATFKIYLPIAEEPGQMAEAALPEPALTYGTETILVVEDDEMVRQLVCETLA